MKRVLIGLVIGLLLLEAGRRLYRPADEAAAAASAAYRAGDYATAEARFREAERESADKAPLAYNRAAAQYRLRRFDDADHSYQRSADDEALHAARADYDRGNCDFGEACKDEGTADADLLRRAARRYEACLAREGSVQEPGPLFDDARHNLELTRLILSEFTEKEKQSADEEKEKPEPEVAKDDPFAPSNAAHPNESPEGQTPQGDGAKGDKDQQQPKPEEMLAKNDAPPNQPRPCKDCKRGGCPKCKKPGKGPGPNQTSLPGEGPKPTPGKGDNGKTAGKGKSDQEVPHPDPGPGKKGKPGDGGKPNPNGKNGIGHTTEKGDGQVDPGAKSEKTGAPSEGKMVGPDGVLYERKDQQNKPSQGGKGEGGEGESSEAKKDQQGAKNGSQPGAHGEADQPRASKNQPKPADVDKLFRPGTTKPSDGNAPGQGGTLAGPAQRGSGQVAPDADETDGSGDPRERAAVRRLRQAVQRIEKSRESRPAPQAPAKGEPPDPDRRRDW